MAWVIGPMVRSWSGTPLTPAQRRAVAALALLAAAALAVLDTFTKEDLPNGLYLIPVVVATALVSGTAGTAVAVGAAIGDFIESFTGKGHESLPTAIVGAFLLLVSACWMIALTIGLRNALRAAERSERRSREFLNYAAHQLRTPLMGLGASAEALVMLGVPPMQERLVANIATDAGRVGRLTSSLLRLARLDAGGPQAPSSPVDLVRLCDRQVAVLRSGRPDLEVVLSVPWRAPATSWLDAEATGEALANLLDNASRHAIHRIAVHVRAADDELTVSVTDDGPGPPEGDRERIFERFVSLDSDGGSGLGLPIARGLIERQGGTLRWQDGGFVITLPATPAPAGTARRPPPGA